MTQNDMILNHLKSGRPITPLQALSEFGCFRLAARIWELREDGHDVKMKRVLVKKNTTVARYYMEEKQ